jgi:hypothetical protein
MLPFNPTARGQRRDAGDTLSEARFLSLSDGRTYAIPQPGPAVSDRLCVGSSSDGWLVTADAASDLHLLNPLTGAQVLLPPPDTLPFVHASCDANGRVISYSIRCCFDEDDAAVVVPPESFAPDRLRFELYEKAVIVSAPRKGLTGSWEGYAVMLICQPLSRLAIARAGDKRWTPVDTPLRRWVDTVRASSEAGDGGRQLVYAMDTDGHVEAWGVDATTVTREVVAPACCCSGRACYMSGTCSRYLVELSPGRLLQVHRIREAAHARYGCELRPERVEYTTVDAEIFEWTDGERWVPVDNSKSAGVLAGRALFLGKNTSLCVPVDGCPELKGNDGPSWSHDRCREVAPDVGVLDLTDGSYRPPRGAARGLLWKWPPPIWVFPSCAD